MQSTHTTANTPGNRSVAILTTGLLAGTLDISAACIQYYLKTEKDPANVLRYVASGVFGKAAFTGGTAMAAWGLLFHYLIAFGLTIFFFWLYPPITWIGRNIVAAGIFYALFAWLITTQVIVRLSKVPSPPSIEIKKIIVPILILIVCIGLPIALMTHRYYRRATINRKPIRL